MRQQQTGPVQGALEGLPVPKARKRRSPQPTAIDHPIARVAVDVTPAHLDRVFDYTVPATMDQAAQPGVRVRVRFAGTLTGGFLLERAASSDHSGTLMPLARVVSGERVLTPEIAGLARAVADHYAGTLVDVLRFAIPARHARTENEPAAELAPRPAASSAKAWADYPGGAAFLRRLAAGDGPRAVWTALPGVGENGITHAAAAIADAVTAATATGHGAVVVAPDARDVAMICRALEGAGHIVATATTGGNVVRLVADDGPAHRYRSFLAAVRGQANVVVGTRSAAFAPVANTGLLVCWNDGEDTLAEPHAPYPHARDVLALRATRTGAGLLVGSVARSVATQSWLAHGWARELAATRPVVRARAPRPRALTSTELAVHGPGAAARIPAPAHRAVRDGLAHGPVLVQVPRTGYIPVTACATCRTPARCAVCHGPLALTGADQAPQCGWCGALAGAWTCTECHGHHLRSVRVGSARTAEELGRAFPGHRVVVSSSTSATGILDQVESRPMLVVATPGAEPVAPGGYATALLLDAAVATASTALNAGEDALYRWLAAASLVRPASEGGTVLLVGDGAPTPTGAFIRWDPAGFADRELEERRELGLPPTVRAATVTGDRDGVALVVSRVQLATPETTIGPVEADEPVEADGIFAAPVRTIIRVPRTDGTALAAQLAASLRVRSARREAGNVRVHLDPKDLT